MLRTVSFSNTLHRKLRGDSWCLRRYIEEAVARFLIRYAFSSSEMEPPFVNRELEREWELVEGTRSWTMEEADCGSRFRRVSLYT
jgi:hypothetical protein